MLTRSVLAAWWNADDHAVPSLMTDDGSGVISSWKDCINSIDLTATSTARPTWGATAFNGRAGVTGDGIANVLSLAGVPSTLPTGASPGVLITVHSNTGDGSGNNNLFGYGVAANGRALRTISSGTGLRATGDAVSIGDDVISELGAHIGVAIFTGTELRGRIDGRPFVGSFPTLALVPNTATNRVRMFGSLGTTASNLWPGVVRHAMVLAGTPSDAILQQVEGWAAWNSGLQAQLPDSHPYKRAKP